MSLDKDFSDSLLVNTSSADAADQTADDSQRDTRSFSHYVSHHSSRSSSFNESSAEIILGLFREENRIDAGFGIEYTNEEDPAVREMLILTEAQKPGSWVSRRLAMVELWNDDNGGTNSGERKQTVKRPRSPSEDSEETTETQSKRAKGEGAHNASNMHEMPDT